MMEEWRAVVGFEGSYEISSEGNVRSTARTRMARGAVYPVRSRPVAKHNHRAIHLDYVALWKNTSQRRYFVCVLMAATFPERKVEFESDIKTVGEYGSSIQPTLDHLNKYRGKSRRSATIDVETRTELLERYAIGEDPFFIAHALGLSTARVNGVLRRADKTLKRRVKKAGLQETRVIGQGRRPGSKVQPEEVAEIYRLHDEGKSNSEIARALDLNRVTVENWLKRRLAPAEDLKVTE